MAIDDSRRPEPADPQPGPIGSDDGLTLSEFGRPPTPGEVTGTTGSQDAEGVRHPRDGETTERLHVEDEKSGGTDA